MSDARIHVGIGGWIYPPWRGTFYPLDLPPDRELEFASRAVTAIEINSTYYKLQSPAIFAKWAATVPEDFTFTVKGSRFCTNRKNLVEAAQGIERFISQGLTELGDKLGPILWQLMPTKQFNPEEIRSFLSLLPKKHAGIKLRHALEVRHESFRDPEYLAILRAEGVANVVADSPEYPQIADCTGSFVYVRLRDAREQEPLGYTGSELDRWTRAAQDWSRGKRPLGLSYVDTKKAPPEPTDVFVYMINGAKVRAPAAAKALIERLAGPAKAAPIIRRRPAAPRGTD